MDREKTMKVLLLNPPLYFHNGNPVSMDTSVPPLGVLYLAGYINEYSDIFQAEVVDMSAERISLVDMVARIKQESPFVVGISAMTPQLQGCLELAQAINDSKSGSLVFLGGSHISADPYFIMRFSRIFHYGISGEAEKTFLSSLERLLAKGVLPVVQKGDCVQDLDIIPFPKYDKKIYNGRQSMVFSRGCPYNCYYCSRPAVDNKVRYRSAKNMFEELKTSNGKVDFQDDTFTLDKARVIELCLEIMYGGLKIDWRCNTRIDLVNEELLRFMKKAGCSLIHFGIEAGNEEIRNQVVNKSFSNKEIYEVIKLCKRMGIKTAGYFILGHPGETYETLNDTERMIFTSGIDLLGLSLPTPFPGSRLYEMAQTDRVINDETIDDFAKKELGEGYLGNYPVFISSHFSQDYLYDFMRRINRRFYFSFRILWGRLREDIFSFRKIRQDAKDFISLLLRGVSSRKPYVQKS